MFVVSPNATHVGLVRIINLKQIRMVEQKIQNFLDKKGIKRGFGLLNETTNVWIKIFDLLKEYEALSQHDVIKAVCDCHLSGKVQMCNLPDCHGRIPT
jgi:hypothetical protein